MFVGMYVCRDLYCVCVFVLFVSSSLNKGQRSTSEEQVAVINWGVEPHTSSVAEFLHVYMPCMETGMAPPPQCLHSSG